MASESILIVEDDLGIQKLLALYFEKRGYDVEIADDGKAAMEILKNNSIDIIVLDIEMPLMDGYEVCQKVRAYSDIPIIFISNNRMIEDKLKGLNLGGDDYITKPFDFEELHARIKSNLRRYQLLTNQSKVFRADNHSVEINVESKECFINGKKIELTAIETDILMLLVEEPNRVFSLEQIYDGVWGHDHIGDPLTVKVHIKNLRNKIEKDSTNPTFIVTVRGFGYRFNFENET